MVPLREAVLIEAEPGAAASALLSVRQEIDETTQTLVHLLEQRHALVLDAAKIKRALMLPMEDQQRESAVISAALVVSAGILPPENLAAVLRAIISESKAAAGA